MNLDDAIREIADLREQINNLRVERDSDAASREGLRRIAERARYERNQLREAVEQFRRAIDETDAHLARMSKMRLGDSDVVHDRIAERLYLNTEIP
jgi:chromosome segregation ATPase